MKLIWWFCEPSLPAGYGIVTKYIVPRMIKDGHSVVVASRYRVGAPFMDQGMMVFSGNDGAVVKAVNDTERIDYTFYAINENSASYRLAFPNWVACAAFDYEFLPPDMAEGIRQSKFQFTVSRNNQIELERHGMKADYCPWGVDTNLFKPSEELRKKRRQEMGWDNDTFVIGTVGQNLLNDRKNHINLLKAFKIFSMSHLNSALYMHTSAYSMLPLQAIVDGLGLHDKVSFYDQKIYHMNALPHEGLPEIYNSLDVICIPSKGESFCLPFVEAQACGVPLITTDTTSGPELMKGGWLIPIDDDDFEYLTFGTWNAVVRPSKINEQLENAYSVWRDRDQVAPIVGEFKNEWDRRKYDARKGSLEFDWDLVYEKYWRPFLNKIEEAKHGKL